MVAEQFLEILLYDTYTWKDEKKSPQTKKGCIGVSANEDKRAMVAGGAGSLHRLKDLFQMLYTF